MKPLPYHPMTTTTVLTTEMNPSMGGPTSYDEVLRRPDQDHWIRAMNDELVSQTENGTWILADLPEGRKAIRNKWVLQTK